jgi:uncharacterized protein (DUF1697 family)
VLRRSRVSRRDAGLASGNVVFAVDAKAKAPTVPSLEAMQKAHFGYAIPVILRSAAEIAAMFGSDPFRGVDPKRETCFVTMLADGIARPRTLPWPAGAGFRFVGKQANNLFLVRPAELAATPEMMTFLDKAFGPAITTRNWNTMERIAAALELV